MYNLQLKIAHFLLHSGRGCTSQTQGVRFIYK